MLKLDKNLDFDPERHQYTLFGEPIPSVSAIIEMKYPFPDFLKDTVKIVDAMGFGVAVHQTTECYDLGEEIIETPYDTHEMLKRWQLFLDDYNVEFLDTGKGLAVELMLADQDNWYCGTIDRIAYVDGVLSVIDIKSGWLTTRGRVQVAGYVRLAIKNGFKVKQGMLVSLKDKVYARSDIEARHHLWFQECLEMYYSDGRPW